MLEHYFHPVQVWLILPLFALANAGVHFDSHILEAWTHPIGLGIIAGLVLGKPLGIAFLSWMLVKSAGTGCRRVSPGRRSSAQAVWQVSASRCRCSSRTWRGATKD